MPDDPYKPILAIRDRQGKPVDLYPFQTEFLEKQRLHRYNFIVGGAGPGKTEICALAGAIEVFNDQVYRAQPYALRLLLTHTDRKKARNVVFRKLRRQLPKVMVNPRTGKVEEPLFGINKQDGEAYWGFGEDTETACQILWMGMSAQTGQVDELADMGEGFDMIIPDQIEKYPEEAIWVMSSRLGRDSVPDFRARMVATANPRKNWLKKLIIDKKYPAGQDATNWYVKNVTIDDRPDASPEYIASLEGLPKAMRDRLRYGLWDAVEGLLYEDFGDANQVAFRRIPFEKSWRLIEFFDWGHWPHPFGVVWCVLDHRGNLFVIQEDEFYRHSPKDAARRILLKRGELAAKIAKVTGWTDAEAMSLYQGSYGWSDFNRTEAGMGQTLGDQMLTDRADTTWRGIAIRTVTVDAEGKESIEQARIMAVAQMVSPQQGHFCPVAEDDGSYATPAPTLYVAEECERAIEQLGDAEYNEDRPGHMLRNEVRNEYAKDAGGHDIPDAVHHWDIESCVSGAVQVVRFPREPQAKTVTNPEWERHQKLVAGRSRHKYARS